MSAHSSYTVQSGDTLYGIALKFYGDGEKYTIKYTGEDSVVNGYAIHVENVHTEPNLLVLYTQMNAGGRRSLPALRAAQPFGRALGNEIQVAIRDAGRFMDCVCAKIGGGGDRKICQIS